MTDTNLDTPLVVEPNPSTGGKHGFIRYGMVLPLAAVMTVGLTLTMAALVAAEFSPQDKSETASFEINPQVENLPPPLERVEIEPIEHVDIPPPPERLPITKEAVGKPTPVEIPGDKDVFDPTTLVIDTNPIITTVDKDPTPLVRIPPTFPNRFLQGDVSGYCRVSFDVSPQGQPFNVSATVCTNRMLKSPTIKSVQKWKYAPKIQNGRAVSRSGLETTVQFNLNDEQGNPLPLPSGY